MKRLHLLATATSLLILAACQTNKSKSTDQSTPAVRQLDPGTIENSIYRNEYFGFRVTLPAAWSVQERAATQRLAERGNQLLAGDDPALKAALKESRAQSVNLFTVFQHPLGTPVSFNPSISAVAENVRDYPGIKSGKDYLFHARNIMRASQVKMDFEEETTSVKLGGVEFHRMDGSITVGLVTVQQTYYAAIRDGYALNFILTGSNDAEARDLQKIIDSLSFEK